MTKKKPLPAGSRGDSDDVETFLATLQHPSMRAIRALRAVIRGAGRSIREGIKWNAPSFHTTEHFATFSLRHKDGVQVVLHLGAKPRSDTKLRTGITDPESLLQWRGPDRATVTFCDLAEIKKRKGAFVKVIRQWITFV